MIENYDQDYVKLFKKAIEKILYSEEAFKQVDSLIKFLQQDENQAFVQQYLLHKKTDSIELFFIKDNPEIQINTFNEVNAYSIKISPAYSIGKLNVLFNRLLTNKVSFSDSKKEIIKLIQDKLDDYYQKLYIEILKDNFFENIILDTNHNYLIFQDFIPIVIFNNYVHVNSINDLLKKIKYSTKMNLIDILIYFLKKDKIDIITAILEDKNNTQLITKFNNYFNVYIENKLKNCKDHKDFVKLINHYSFFLKYDILFEQIIKQYGYTLVMSDIMAKSINYKPSVQLLNNLDVLDIKTVTKYKFKKYVSLLIPYENKEKWTLEMPSAIKLNLVREIDIPKLIFIRISSENTRKNMGISDHISLLTKDNILY